MTTALPALELSGGGEAEGEVVGLFQAGGVEDGRENIPIGEVGELIGELRHGHVPAVDEAAEDGIGDARVFAVGAGALMASGAAEGIGGLLQFGVGVG